MILVQLVAVIFGKYLLNFKSLFLIDSVKPSNDTDLDKEKNLRLITWHQMKHFFEQRLDRGLENQLGSADSVL